jgi:tetratricopeptide (TPR) repeat protein
MLNTFLGALVQAKSQRKAEAQAEKELGNAAYKKKDFEEAVKHYDKAIELFDEDISFLTNKCVGSQYASLHAYP